MIGDMRQGVALVRGAAVVSALVAVPLGGPVAAHAVTLPGASVDAGPVHVSTPPVNVPTPSVPAPSIPHVPVGGPAGGAANGVIDRGNNTVHQVLAPPGSSSSGGPGGSPSAGSGSPPPAGPTPPGGKGGNKNGGGGGAKPKTGPRAKAAARRRRAANRARRAAVNRKRYGARAVHAKRVAKKSSHNGSDNPFASVLSSIEQVIPGPVLALIGILALLAAGFALRSTLVSRRARRLERQKEELLGDVGLLQRALLPDVPEDLTGIDVSVAYRPAEGPAAGGGLFGVFEVASRRTRGHVG